MKKTVFVISHLCSGSDALVDSLNKNKLCMILENSIYYDSISSLEKLTNYRHKIGDHPQAVYGDHLLYNFLFSCKRLYEISKFIYVICTPRKCLNKIIDKHKKYNEERALNYYTFRLRRIYEMAKRTPGAVFLTQEDLQNENALFIIEKYLGISHIKDVELKNDETKNIFNEVLIEKAEECYEKYFYKIKNLNLKNVKIN